MVIRVSRDGVEIVSIDSVENLRQAVKSHVIRNQDLSLLEGDDSWLTVEEQLRRLVDKNEPLTSAGFSAVHAGGLNHDDKVYPRHINESSAKTIGDVVQAVPQERSNAIPRRRKIVPYTLPLLFIGIASILICFGWINRDVVGTQGSGKGLPNSEKRIYRDAVKKYDDAGKLYEQAKGKTVWSDDDENGIREALNRYEQAWSNLHGRSEYPKGELMSEHADVSQLERDLKDKIKLCRKEVNIWPWPL